VVREVIGREGELAAMAQFLDSVPAGPAGLVLEGEAGSGKTTLWNAAVEAARERSYQVLTARAAQAEAKLSFAACADLLAPVAEEALAALPAPQRRALEVALLLAEPGGSLPEHRAVAAGFASAVAALTARGPVLVAVDDVQWLDEPSARVLEFVARRLHGRPVGVLASARASGQAAVALGLDRALPEDRLVRLQLGPLGLAAIHQLLWSRLGAVFPRHTLVKLQRASGGNPFFALELARALLRRGGLILLDGGDTVMEALQEGLSAGIIAPLLASALDQAAARARARGAPDAAAGLAGLARQLTPPESVDDRRSRAIAQADYRSDAGDLLGAVTLLEEVIACMPPGPSRAEALRRLGRAHYLTGGGQSALRYTEQALREAGADPVLRARAQVDLASVAGAYGDQSVVLAHARSAVDLAEAAGDVSTLAEALALAALHGCARGLQDQDHEALMRRALALEERSDRIRPYLRPTYISAYLLVWADRLDEARSRLEGLRGRMLDQGDESALPVVLFLLSDLECMAGRWAEAARHADEGCAVALANGQHFYRTLAMSAKALALAHLGVVADARKAAEEGLALGRRMMAPAVVSANLQALGFLELSLGDPAAADRHLSAVARGLAATGATEPGIMRFLPDEVEAVLALGKLDEATALLEPFEERARALDRAWALATGARCRGLLQAARCDLDGAASALEEAVRAHGRLAMPFELGRTLLVKGGIHRRRKEKGAARDALEQAQRVFEELGAPLWAERARSELLRVGLRPRAPHELTATEERVAALAASGLTNRQVAQELFISPKTVEANLAKVYRKFGIRSRAELGARMAAREGHAGPAGPA